MADNLKPARPTSYVSLDETSRALLDASVESAMLVDVSGFIMAANQVAADLFKLESASDFEGVNIFDLLPEPSARSMREHIQSVVLNVEPARYEEVIDDLSLIHSIVPVTNPWGEVFRLAVKTQNVTELRRTDEDLRREQQRQIFFMESLPGIVYHLYPDQTIRYANRYFRKYFGSPKGKNCAEALSCTGKICGSCPPMEAMQTDRATEWDWTDAKGRTFHLQCSPMTDSSGDRMIMVLGIDITARKRAEDALKLAHDKLEDRVRQRTRELEKANDELTRKSRRLVSAMEKADAATRAKSAFLANMSHEIRTPLNAVLGMAELALRVGPEKKNRYLNRVLEAGNSLLTVINDILDFSKIEARKLNLETIDFDIRRVIDAALDINRIQTDNKSLTLTFEVADDVPPALVGDPTRIRQVLLNLLSNAVKFTETGGIHVAVTVAAGPNTPNQGDQITLLFAVADTGIGIPEKAQKAIFDSFQQADDSVTRKHGGTGLGLAICKLLVELMGGTIRLQSVEGQGSTFSFTARFQVGNPAAVPDETKEAERELPTLPRLKVLLADDNALNRELVITLLAEQGHEVVDVENGAQALEAAKEQRFDLILMDVQMPIMDGVTATRAIRDKYSGALDPTIPIIALTAHALVGDRERFLEAGMDGYVSKPIKMQEFYTAIESVITGRTIAPTDAKDGPAAGTTYFDRDNALEMLGGRDDLLARMDAIFLRDVPGELAEFTRAMEAGGWEEAQRLAHSIKGSARTVGAVGAGALAEQMEFFCKQKDGKSAQREFKNLESEVNLALQYIEGVRDTSA